MNPFEGYRLTSPYGMRSDPFDGSQKMHTGIDLVIADKAPLYAFMGGTVVHSGEGKPGSGFGGFGNVVALLDINCSIQFYAHLYSVSVKVGQVVHAGQEVGKQGNTGHSAGSHLHFEVRANGNASGFGFGSNTEPTAYLQNYMEDDKTMKEELAAAIKRIGDLEEKIKGLDKTAPPSWFTKEFGSHCLDGIVSDLTGDTNFWRNTAVSLRLKRKG